MNPARLRECRREPGMWVVMERTLHAAFRVRSQVRAGPHRGAEHVPDHL